MGAKTKKLQNFFQLTKLNSQWKKKNQTYINDPNNISIKNKIILS